MYLLKFILITVEFQKYLHFFTDSFKDNDFIFKFLYLPRIVQILVSFFALNQTFLQLEKSTWGQNHTFSMSGGDMQFLSCLESQMSLN